MKEWYLKSGGLSLSVFAGRCPENKRCLHASGFWYYGHVRCNAAKCYDEYRGLIMFDVLWANFGRSLAHGCLYSGIHERMQHQIEAS